MGYIFCFENPDRGLFTTLKIKYRVRTWKIWVVWEVAIFNCNFKAKPSLKIRTASATFWNYLGIFRDYGLKNIFFRNKVFVFQDRKLKLSASVWKRISSNLTKFQLIQLIQTIAIFIFSIDCLIQLKIC